MFLYFLAVHTAAIANADKTKKSKIISCWNPADGTQISCASKTSHCQVNRRGCSDRPVEKLFT
jgi:hypothetical protein